MNSTLMTQTLIVQTPATPLPSYVALTQSCTAPKTAVHGTGLSFAGTSAVLAGAAPAAVAGVRTIDLPGSPSRGAPV